jgi:hypothetical protein
VLTRRDFIPQQSTVRVWTREQRDAYAPLDHMSTPKVYFVEPRRISGALYHLVAT